MSALEEKPNAVVSGLPADDALSLPWPAKTLFFGDSKQYFSLLGHTSSFSIQVYHPNLPDVTPGEEMPRYNFIAFCNQVEMNMQRMARTRAVAMQQTVARSQEPDRDGDILDQSGLSESLKRWNAHLEMAKMLFQKYFDELKYFVLSQYGIPAHLCEPSQDKPCAAEPSSEPQADEPKTINWREFL